MKFLFRLINTIKKERIKIYYLLIIMSTSASIHSLAYLGVDNNGKIYKGLQNWNNVLRVLGISDESEEILGAITPNLREQLLAPWDKTNVSQALPNSSAEIKQKTLEVVQSLFYEKEEDGQLKLLERYDAAGALYEASEVNRIEELIKQATFADGYHDECRAITINNSDALFAPVRTFVTGNLSRHGNTASDQKSSSTVIPKNTPVFILAQIAEYENISTEEDSWLVIWRPEFGIKFVLSKDVGFFTENQNFTNYIKFAHSTDGLLLTSTDRVVATDTPPIPFSGRIRLISTTPVLQDPKKKEYITDYQGPKATTEFQNDEKMNVSFHLYEADLTEMKLVPLDQKNIYKYVVEIPSEPYNVEMKAYLQHLHNAIYPFPPYIKNAPNRLFAWGEGVVGHGGQRGQDSSTFIRKIFLPLGLSLPRYSLDQIAQGEIIHPIHTSTDPTMFFNDMVKHGEIGVFASFGAGNNMACLGSVTLMQLAELDKDAANDAKEMGGMTEEDRVPLIVASPVGFKRPDGQWDITPKTAIYPLTKKGVFSSWINSTRQKISFFSYFSRLF